jgi:hypothetical protein
MVDVGSMAMWITGMTRTMGIADRCRDVERSRSITSRAMKLAMVAGMWARPGMKVAESTRYRASMAAVVVAGRAAAADTRVAADVTSSMN